MPASCSRAISGASWVSNRRQRASASRYMGFRTCAALAVATGAVFLSNSRHAGASQEYRMSGKPDRRTRLRENYRDTTEHAAVRPPSRSRSWLFIVDSDIGGFLLLPEPGFIFRANTKILPGHCGRNPGPGHAIPMKIGRAHV